MLRVHVVCTDLAAHEELEGSAVAYGSTTVSHCRAKLSDMGLSKRLVPEQVSFESVGSGGSSGWQAPEQLIGRSGGSARQTNSGEAGPASYGVSRKPLRFAGPKSAQLLMFAVDVFSFGLLLHYCLTGGQHPFGKQYERDANILQQRLDLRHLQHMPDAISLVRGCCSRPGDARRCIGCGSIAITLSC